MVLRDEGKLWKETRGRRRRQKMKNLLDARTGARLLWEKGSREVRALVVSCYTGLQGSPRMGCGGWGGVGCVCDQSEDGRTNGQSRLGSLLALSDVQKYSSVQ